MSMCVFALIQIVSPIRKINVIQNSSLEISKQYFENEISYTEQLNMISSAISGINEIIKFEPRILEKSEEQLEVVIQPDTVSKEKNDLLQINT